MTSSDLSAFEAEVHNFIGEHLTPDLNKAASLGFGISRADGERWHKAVYNQGWIAPDWPVEHGGTGWSLRQKQIFLNATALAGAPMIMPFGLDMVSQLSHTFGTDEQKAAHLPKILDGSVWWCQGYSEPGSGSDLASLKTPQCVTATTMW